MKNGGTAKRPKWMDILPVSPDKLSFEELRNFKWFYDHIEMKDMTAPVTVTSAYRAFRILYFFACALIHEKRYPSLNRCWDDLRARFAHSPVFDDGVFLESWIFIDFPLDLSGRTVLDEFAAFCASTPEAMAACGAFIESAKRSRLGLHQEIISTSRTTKYKELLTGTVTSTLRSVPHYEHGEIFLGRIIESGGDRFLLGDPKNWPAKHRDMIIDMIEDRLFDMPGSTRTEKYERFMRLAGPYWMSCVCGGYNDEVLSPAHMKSYYVASVSSDWVETPNEKGEARFRARPDPVRPE